MYVTSTSLVCPVGLSAGAACSAMRAGVAGFIELPFLDNRGKPVLGAPVPDLEFTARRGPRSVQLLAGALRELVSKNPRVPWDRVPLVVGLAEPGRPGGNARLAESIVPAVQESVGHRFHPRLSRALPRGHVAGFEGLRSARDVFRDPDAPACVVAGVDSYLNAASLRWLDDADRLKTFENSNGVIPGEAAGAVLVERRPPAAGAGLHVAGLGFGVEPAPVLSEEPFLGFGLAAATRAALGEAGLALHETDLRLSDLTGESYGFKEQALLLSRVMTGRRAEFPVWHCAENVGDTGAAAGLCQLVCAFQAFESRYAPGDRAVGFASSVPGDRAVVVLRRHAPGPAETRKGEP